MSEAVSIIIPVHNSAATLEEAVLSAFRQDYGGLVEVVCFDDGSTDASPSLIDKLAHLVAAGTSPHCTLTPVAMELSRDVDRLCGVSARSETEAAPSPFAGPRTLVRGRSDRPHGPGFARNEAVRLSSGDFLCLLDADDVAAPQRLRLQLQLARTIAAGGAADAALGYPGGPPQDVSLCLIGCGFTRLPAGSTAAYAAWCNQLTPRELRLQQWRECTVIQPSWFMHRRLWERLGGWDELPPPFCRGGLGSAAADGAGGAFASSGAGAGSSCGAAGAAVASSLPSLSASAAPAAAAAAGFTAADGAPAETAPQQAYGILARPPLRLARAHEDDGAALRSHVFASFPEDTLFFHRHLHWAARESAAAAAGAAAADAAASVLGSADSVAAAVSGSGSSSAGAFAALAAPVAAAPHNSAIVGGAGAAMAAASATESSAPRSPSSSAHQQPLPLLLARVPLPLLMYRYSESSQSWRIPRQLLLRVRVALFEERVLGLRQACSRCSSHERGGGAAAAASGGAGCGASAGAVASGSPRCDASCCVYSGGAAAVPGSWPSGKFTIWGAGRDGKAFYNALSDEGKARVVAFADIDEKKIGQRYPPPPRGVPAASAAAGVAGGAGADAPMSKKKQKAAARAAKQMAAAAVAMEPAAEVATMNVDAEAPSVADPLDTPTSIATTMPAAKRPRLSASESGPGTVTEAPRAARGGQTITPANPIVSHPIVHFTKLQPPAVICVAIGTGDRGDEVRRNVAAAGLTEGDSAWFFV